MFGSWEEAAMVKEQLADDAPVVDQIAIARTKRVTVLEAAGYQQDSSKVM